MRQGLTPLSRLIGSSSSAVAPTQPIEGPHPKLDVTSWPASKKRELAELIVRTAAKFGGRVHEPETPLTETEQQRLEALQLEVFGSPQRPGPRPTTAGMSDAQKRELAEQMAAVWLKWGR
jgi:hypothetical protein